jgi:hypothetical protein
MRRRVPTLLAVLAVMPAAIGCGGGDDGRGDYAKALNQAQTDLAQRFVALQRGTSPTSTPDQEQQALLRYENAVRATVGRLRAVDPPAGFDALHRQFVAEVAGYGTALRTARTRLADSTGSRAVLDAQARLKDALTRTGRQLDATIRAINDKLGA